jgi:hypothetical protein
MNLIFTGGHRAGPGRRTGEGVACRSRSRRRRRMSADTRVIAADLDREGM